jgi:hypothetical protein
MHLIPKMALEDVSLKHCCKVCEYHVEVWLIRYTHGAKGPNPQRKYFFGESKYLFISKYFEMQHSLRALLWFVQIFLNSHCSVYLLIMRSSTH